MQRVLAIQVPGYRGSGLFRAFSDFVLHRLQIPLRQSEPKANKLRVTFLSRQTTFRRVLNEDQIIQAIKANKTNLTVTKVCGKFCHGPKFVCSFSKQNY